MTTLLTRLDDRSSGEALKRAMAERKVTVKGLSEATGLSERTITALRSGRSAGNFATWRAISRALRVPVDELTR